MSRDKLSERWEDYYSTAIEKGLKAALADLSIEKSFDEIRHGHIKLNKLMYIAMAERGLHEDMQHSWHRYGADLGTLVSSTDSVGPTPGDDLPETEKPSLTEDRMDESEVWSEKDYCEFFKNVELGSLKSLEEILEADRSTLLEEFYTEYSGDIEEWIELYLINVRVQEVLSLYQTEDISQFNSAQYQEFARMIGAFRKELYSHQELSPSKIDEFDVDLSFDENPADLLSEYLDLIDDVYYEISKRSPESLNSGLAYPLGIVEDFYHERAWNLVTKVISLNTPHGPNQEAILSGSTADIEKLVRKYRIKMERVESECRAADLLPEPDGGSESPTGDSIPGDDLPTRSEFRKALRGEEA